MSALRPGDPLLGLTILVARGDRTETEARRTAEALAVKACGQLVTLGRNDDGWWVGHFAMRQAKPTLTPKQQLLLEMARDELAEIRAALAELRDSK